MINYSCPHCGQNYEIPDEHAGKSGRCKQCEETITVPLPIVEPSSEINSAEHIISEDGEPKEASVKNRDGRESPTNTPNSERTSSPRTKGNLYKAIGVTLVVLLIGLIASAPFRTVSEIKSAIVDQDSERLSDNVNFPVLRQNFKDQFNAIMAESFAEDDTSDGMGLLAAGFATTMVDKMVDMLITPTALANLMKGQSPKSGTGDSVEEDDLFKDADYSYDTLNRFSVLVPSEDGEAIRFVLRREGFRWQLTNIVFPIENEVNNDADFSESKVKEEVDTIGGIKRETNIQQLQTPSEPTTTTKESEIKLLDDPDFRNTKWGNSMSEVRSQEAEKLGQEQDNMMLYETTINGWSAIVGYIFLNDKLVRAKYMITEDHSVMLA